MRNALGWKWKPFEIPAEILDNWRQTQRRSLPAYNRWVEKASAAGSEFRDFIANRLPRGWDTALNALKEQAIAEKDKSCHAQGFGNVSESDCAACSGNRRRVG